LRMVNTYRKFILVLKRRWELIIEGSEDDSTWIPYEFLYKVGDPNRRLCFLSFHLPRIDWRVWILGGGHELRQFYKENQFRGHLTFRGHIPEWYSRLLHGILENNESILNLLGTNPFPNGPPKYLRTRVFWYRYNQHRTPNNPGVWVRQDLLLDYGGIVSTGE